MHDVHRFNGKWLEKRQKPHSNADDRAGVNAGYRTGD